MIAFWNILSIDLLVIRPYCNCNLVVHCSMSLRLSIAYSRGFLEHCCPLSRLIQSRQYTRSQSRPVLKTQLKSIINQHRASGRTRHHLSDFGNDREIKKCWKFRTFWQELPEVRNEGLTAKRNKPGLHTQETGKCIIYDGRCDMRYAIRRKIFETHERATIAVPFGSSCSCPEYRYFSS